MNESNRHAEILYYDIGGHQECDMCDNVPKELVILDTLGRDCLVICKKCLEKIIEGFDKE